jgi:hypothetical protein
MDLIQSVKEQIQESEQFCAELLEYEQRLLDGEELTTESVHSVLDRIGFKLSQGKFGISDSDKNAIARTIAALLLIKKNLNGKHGPALKDIMDQPHVNDYAQELDKAVPGVVDKQQSFIERIKADLAGEGKQTEKLVKDLRDLGPTGDPFANEPKTW